MSVVHLYVSHVLSSKDKKLLDTSLRLLLLEAMAMAIDSKPDGLEDYTMKLEFYVKQVAKCLRRLFKHSVLI